MTCVDVVGPGGGAGVRRGVRVCEGVCNPVITIRYYHSEPVCVEYGFIYRDTLGPEAKSNLVTLNSLHSAFKKKRNK